MNSMISEAILEIKKYGLIPIEEEVSLSKGVSFLLQAFHSACEWIEKSKHLVDTALQQCSDASQRILRTGGPSLSVDQKTTDLENPRTQSELESCRDLVTVVKQVIEEAKEQ